MAILPPNPFRSSTPTPTIVPDPFALFNQYLKCSAPGSSERFLVFRCCCFLGVGGDLETLLSSKVSFCALHYGLDVPTSVEYSVCRIGLTKVSSFSLSGSASTVC